MVKKMRIELNGLDETDRFGKKLGSFLKPGDTIALIGDLGTGKTTLTKSIALGMGIEDRVTSATFTLINVYEGKIPMYHFDVYRLDNISEMDYMGFDEYFYGDGVSVVEWADKIVDFLPEEYLEIIFERISEDSRIITIKGYGKRGMELEELC